MLLGSGPLRGSVALFRHDTSCGSCEVELPGGVGSGSGLLSLLPWSLDSRALSSLLSRHWSASMKKGPQVLHLGEWNVRQVRRCLGRSRKKKEKKSKCSHYPPVPALGSTFPRDMIPLACQRGIDTLLTRILSVTSYSWIEVSMRVASRLAGMSGGGGASLNP